MSIPVTDNDKEQVLLGQLFSPEYVRDPYPLLKQLRDYNPMFKPAGTNMWLVTRYRYVNELLRDKRLGHDYDRRMLENHGDQVFVDNGAYRLLQQTMLLKDPPDHKRIRSLAAKAFGAARINEMQPQIEAIVDELLDDLQTRNSGDLLHEFAFKLPVIVICDMLGIPVEDRTRFLEGSNISGRLIDPTPLSEAELAEENSRAAESAEYFAALCQERRERPQDDLVTALVQAETDEGKLSRDELVANIGLLFGAGHETTVNLIGNGLVALFSNPEQLAKIKANPTLIPGLVEELLRFDSSVQITARTALEDVEFEGRLIKQGEEVMTLLGAANHDPEQYANPDKLDVERDKVKPVSFGGGIHTCIGAQLARIEAAVAFERLFARLPELQLTQLDNPDWKATITLRGLTQLPATW
ncbi:MAG: cytochrome P450 [Urechidicola sp.]|jgi:cytochrome P450